MILKTPEPTTSRTLAILYDSDFKSILISPYRSMFVLKLYLVRLVLLISFNTFEYLQLKDTAKAEYFTINI